MKLKHILNRFYNHATYNTKELNYKECRDQAEADIEAFYAKKQGAMLLLKVAFVMFFLLLGILCRTYYPLLDVSAPFEKEIRNSEVCSDECYDVYMNES